MYTLERVDDGHQKISIKATIGTILKYRYVEGTSPERIEHTLSGTQVQFRALPVMGSDLIEDHVAAWEPLPTTENAGRIQGIITDKNDLPLINIMVCAAGYTTLTAADGSYFIENIPPGNHILSAFSLNGSYQPFYQGAVIASNLTTPANIHLTEAKLVNVTFHVNSPPENITNSPIRIIGDLFQLGNLFTELKGSTNIISSRAPLMSSKPDGSYQITLALPAGYNLHYKYTLGDGFWNAEHTSNGDLNVRELLVPDSDLQINDEIETWKSGTPAPVTFHVSIPSTTDTNDTVSIQFNQSEWTEPISMWPLGNNEWVYILYNPMDIMGKIDYRYCRNDQCGIADDLATVGTDAKKNTFNVDNSPQGFNDIVEDWAWWTPALEPTSVLATEIIPRGKTFLTGVEFIAGYHPSWQSRLGWSYKDLHDIGAGWVFLSPTWSYIGINPPILEQVPGNDAVYFDLTQSIIWANQSNLKTAIFPFTITNSTESADWWSKGELDADWWHNWFSQYRTFILHHAKLAAQTNADGLIMGEPGMLPALPQGILPDGTPSKVPDYANEYWRSLINDVKTMYNRPLIWALNYPFDMEQIPDFLSELDQIYILFTAPVGEQGNLSPQEYAESFGKILDENILPFKEEIGKPIIIGLEYPSTEAAADGCLPKLGYCQKYEEYSPYFNPETDANVDLIEQMEIYNGALLAINNRPWIDGVVSRGYYPPAPLHDPSTSIHGKPAADVLWYIYPRWTQ